MTTATASSYTTTDHDDGILPPTVTIDRFVLERLWRYVDKCNIEVSGFGFATQKDGHLHIIDARVVKQDSAGGAHTDINKDALNKLMYEWRNHDGIFVWWHSHVNMGVEWSFTDKTTILDLGKNGMVLALVLNKKHEFRCALSFKADLPYRDGPQIVMLDDIKMSAVLSTPQEMYDQWDKELAEAMPPPSTVHHGGWGGSDVYWEEYQDRIGLHRGTAYASPTPPAGGWDKTEFWKDAEEGVACDIDWQKGSTWVDGVGWRKSWRQRQKEAAEKTAGDGKTLITSTTTPAPSAAPVGNPSAMQDGFFEGRRAYARDDDDIVMYFPQTDEFELVNGIYVDAEWYITKRALGGDPMLQTMVSMTEEEVDDLYADAEAEIVSEQGYNGRD